ncbi:diacylglycerol/lipid kinase family protein [Butyrivibrio sp. YAB3001]|uniref:diacylglycerol/lipid kinase family protein n=1 Tax=Butyrivibrio sp. YAB3001 TaxID=1520812 RepID=UPI0008F65593|nr:YegS/Rv2252/BmrU family lipid kinase [Butyrivibrio sp. YAB3001]SFB76243.1 lipid kinase, YegS/Rv2252/BmrU family [Butyrivibrio sp. YAB3001]
MAGRKNKVLIFINKTSGIGKAGNDTLEIATRYALKGYEPIVYPIIPKSGLTSEKIIAEYAEDFLDVSEIFSDKKEIDGKIEVVLCSGGDGTLNHIVNEIMQYDKKPLLAYIPSGSTNDFAKGLGIPGTRAKAIEVASEGRPVSYDVGKMNDKYFNYVAAFGAFSKVSYATDQELKNVLGYAAYIISALAELPQNIGYSCHMKIEADGVIEEGDYIFGAVSNSSSVAGMNLFNVADVKQDDGEMELLLIKSPKNIAEFNLVLAALANMGNDNSYITYKQVKEVRLSSETEVEWTIDGEFGGAAKDTEISVINKAITILAK